MNPVVPETNVTKNLSWSEEVSSILILPYPVDPEVPPFDKSKITCFLDWELSLGISPSFLRRNSTVDPDMPPKDKFDVLLLPEE